MKMTLRTLAEIRPSLEALLDARGIDTKTSYALSKFSAVVDREFKHIDDARNRYIRDHGEAGPGGPTISPGSTEYGDFITAMESLLETEVDVPVTIKVSLDKIPQGILSPRAIAHLDFIITGETL
jgi:hypothetical protein